MLRSRAGAIRFALSVLVVLTTLVLCSGTATAASSPTLILKPAVGPPTTNVLLAGSGFDPYSTVAIYFDEVQVTQVTTNGAGDLVGSSIGGALSVQVPASAVPGNHWFMATEGNAGKTARTQFMVRTDWPQFHFDAGHSGFNPYENVLSPANVGGLQLAWSYQTGGPVGSPVVANGVLYAGSANGNLYALNAATGALLWTLYGAGTPSVANSTAYVGCAKGMCALNAGTGALLWSFPGAVTPPTVADGVVYFGCGLYVCALNSNSGALLWQYTNVEGISDLAVGNGDVYFGSRDPSNWDQGTFYMLDARTGALLWSHVVGSGPYGGPGFSTPAVGWSVCVNVSFSAEQQVYTDLFCMGEGVEASFNASASAPAVAYGMVYEGVSAYSYPGRHFPATLYAMGQWQYVPLGDSISPQAIANGVVYFSDYSRLYALNASTGALLWQSPAMGLGMPVVANGVVYAGSADGNVYAFSLTGGGSAE